MPKRNGEVVSRGGGRLKRCTEKQRNGMRKSREGKPADHARARATQANEDEKAGDANKREGS